MPGFHGADDARCRLQHRAREQPGRHRAGPAFENLQSLCPSIGLRDQIGAGGVHQQVHQGGKEFGVRPGQLADGFMVGATHAFDHVGGNRPGRAGKSDQRGSFRQRGAHALDGLHHRRQQFGAIGQFGKPGHVPHRLQPRAFAFREPDFLAQCMRHQQNVSEQDGGVEIEAPHRLQGDFHRQFRRQAELDKIFGIGTQGAIFRQVTSRLAHQPDRRYGGRFALQNREKFFHHPRLSRF